DTSVRRRAATRDARPRARPAPERAAARRADLGARPRRARRGRDHAWAPARRTRPVDRAGHPRPRAGRAPGRPRREAGRAVSTSIHVTLGEVAAALGLVAVALAVSLWQRSGVEGDIGVAVARSFVQLTAVGYVVKLVFDTDSLALVVALISAMALMGAFTARGRARRVPGAFWPLLVALAVAGAATLGLGVALGGVPATPPDLVPVGGMIIGNAM